MRAVEIFRKAGMRPAAMGRFKEFESGKCVRGCAMGAALVLVGHDPNKGPNAEWEKIEAAMVLLSLNPETYSVYEYEFGFDVGFVDDRVTLGRSVSWLAGYEDGCEARKAVDRGEL